jgi:Flp pilus assembly protein TadG
MRRDRKTRPARGERDSGSLTLMLAVLLVVLLAFTGLVIDGGRQLNQKENADAIAQEAARAGAGIVNTSTAYSSGSYQVDLPQALAAARSYLANAGYSGSVTGTGDTITVTVTVSENTSLLSLVGIDSMSATGTAVASLVTGVTGPGA